MQPTEKTMQPTLTHWCGRQVIERLPYVMTAEVVVTAGVKGIRVEEADLFYRMARPFVVQEIVLRLTALDEHDAVVDPQPTVLDRLITLRLSDFSKNHRIAADLPFRRLPHGEVIWTPRSPMVMERAEGFEAVFDGRESFAIAGVKTPICAIRAQLSLEGETLVLAPFTNEQLGDAPGPVA